MARSIVADSSPKEGYFTGKAEEYFYHDERPAILVDTDLRIVNANLSAYRWMGTSVNDSAVPYLGDLGLDAQQVEDLERSIREIMNAGEPAHGRQHSLSGREIEYEIIPLHGENGKVEGAALAFTDVTERSMGRRLSETLNEIYRLIISTRPLEEVIPSVIERGGGAIGAGGVGIGVRENGKYVLRFTTEKLRPIRGMKLSEAEARKMFPSLATLAPYIVEDLHGNADFDQEIVTKMGIASLLIVPLVVGDEAIGFLGFNYFKIRATLHPIQIDFAHKVGIALSLALERDEIKSMDEERSTLLRDVIESSPAGIAILKLPGMEVELANSAFTRHMIDGTGIGNMPTQVQRMVKDMIARSLMSGLPSTGVELPIQLDDRTDYWSFTFVPLVRRKKLLLISSNVTSQVEDKLGFQELARREEEERRRLQVILDTLPVGVLVVDSIGTVVETNQAHRAIWDGSAHTAELERLDELEGRWSETGLPLKKEDWPVFQALRTGETLVGAMIDIRRHDGGMGTVLISTAPVKDKYGRITGAVSAMQDITEQRRLEHDALEAKQKMELYLDILSHDVNNLNAAAKGYLELVLDRESMSERGQKQLHNADRALSGISDLIENIRKLQELESMGGAHALVDLGMVLEEVTEAHRASPERKVRIEYRPRIRTMVMANELIRDLFDNLLNNAVKHSSDPVDIRVQLGRTFLDGREYHRVDIEDNGPGIPDELKERLFNRFVRGDTKAGGRGLGLYLVKRISEEFGGRVWVEDRVPGDHTKGARFVICLPVASVSLEMRR